MDIPESIHWSLRKIILNYAIDLNVVLSDPSKIEFHMLIWLDYSMPIPDDEYKSRQFLSECIGYDNISDRMIEWIHERIKWPIEQITYICENIASINNRSAIQHFALIIKNYDRSLCKFNVYDFIRNSYNIGVPIKTIIEMMKYFDCSSEFGYRLAIFIVADHDKLAIQQIALHFNLEWNMIYIHDKHLYDTYSFDAHEWLKNNLVDVKNGSMGKIE